MYFFRTFCFCLFLFRFFLYAEVLYVCIWYKVFEYAACKMKCGILSGFIYEILIHSFFIHDGDLNRGAIEFNLMAFQREIVYTFD